MSAAHPSSLDPAVPQPARGPTLVLVKPTAAESASAAARRLHDEAFALGRSAVTGFIDALKLAQAEGAEIADLAIVPPGLRERARRLADYLDTEVRSLTALQDRFG